MMRYEILNEVGEVVNTIEAETSFVEMAYPGRYRLAEDLLTAPASPVLTQLQFRMLLTPAERQAAREARKVDPIYNDFLELLDIASEIDLTNPLTIAGLSYAASLGVFTPARLAEVLAGSQPDAPAMPALSETDTTWS